MKLRDIASNIACFFAIVFFTVAVPVALCFGLVYTSIRQWISDKTF